MSGLLLDTRADDEQRDTPRPSARRRAPDDHQRHPRLLEDRGRPAGARGRALRPARLRRGRARRRRARARRRRASSSPSDRRRLPGGDRRRRRPAPADRPQPPANAVKFTEAGEVVLTVDGPRRVSRRPPATLAARDRGPRHGHRHPAGPMDRLFQSFSQADASHHAALRRHRARAGDQRRLVELDGRRARRRECGIAGEGSTFRFHDRRPAATAADAAPAARRRRSRPGRPRVLVVDDNATNRADPRPPAARWGMESRRPRSPAEALDGPRRAIRSTSRCLTCGCRRWTACACARDPPSRDADALPLVILVVARRACPGRAFAGRLIKPSRPPHSMTRFTTALGRGRAVPAAPDRPTSDTDLAPRHPLRILLAEDNAVNQKLALRLLERLGYPADVAGERRRGASPP